MLGVIRILQTSGKYIIKLLCFPFKFNMKYEKYYITLMHTYRLIFFTTAEEYRQRSNIIIQNDRLQVMYTSIKLDFSQYLSIKFAAEITFLWSLSFFHVVLF